MRRAWFKDIMSDNILSGRVKKLASPYLLISFPLMYMDFIVGLEDFKEFNCLHGGQ